MAVTPRRVLKWLFLAAAAVLLLVALAVVALLLFVSPDRYKRNVEASLRDSLGREVQLQGALQWHLGRQISIDSADGRIANLPGFSDQPLARWQRLRFSLAAAPLLQNREIIVDRIEIDGLQLRLERNAQGQPNWQLGSSIAKDAPADNGAQRGDQGSAHIGAVALTHADLRYQDAASKADWQFLDANIVATLPEDLNAKTLTFRDLDVQGRLKGGPLMADGVALGLQLPSAQFASIADGKAGAATLTVPSWKLRWSEAEASGDLNLQTGDALSAAGKLSLTAPSLRDLLTTVKINAPLTRDAKVLGALRFSGGWKYKDGAAAVADLDMQLDASHVTGKVDVPRLSPISLRFDLAIDQLNADRYLDPPEVKSKPFELPLAQLKTLDAKGVLRIQKLTVAGANADGVRIDVD
jgi:AsmA protein